MLRVIKRMLYPHFSSIKTRSRFITTAFLLVITDSKCIENMKNENICNAYACIYSYLKVKLIMQI